MFPTLVPVERELLLVVSYYYCLLLLFSLSMSSSPVPSLSVCLCVSLRLSLSISLYPSIQLLPTECLLHEWHWFLFKSVNRADMGPFLRKLVRQVDIRKINTQAITCVNCTKGSGKKNKCGMLWEGNKQTKPQESGTPELDSGEGSREASLEKSHLNWDKMRSGSHQGRVRGRVLEAHGTNHRVA